MIRLFVALDLPEEAKAALPFVDDEVWRPVRREGLHVTLAFIGWVQDDVARAVSEAVGEAVEGGSELGSLWLGDPLLLPPRRPRVLAVALDDPSGRSVALQSSVSERLSSAGLYEPERRPWLPHVTVARARSRSGAPRGAAAGRELPEVPVLEFAAPSVSVYRSVPGAGGARYEALARWGLG